MAGRHSAPAETSSRIPAQLNALWSRPTLPSGQARTGIVAGLILNFLGHGRGNFFAFSVSGFVVYPFAMHHLLNVSNFGCDTSYAPTYFWMPRIIVTTTSCSVISFSSGARRLRLSSSSGSSPWLRQSTRLLAERDLHSNPLVAASNLALAWWARAGRSTVAPARCFP